MRIIGGVLIVDPHAGGSFVEIIGNRQGLVLRNINIRPIIIGTVPLAIKKSNCHCQQSNTDHRPVRLKPMARGKHTLLSGTDC